MIQAVIDALSARPYASLSLPSGYCAFDFAVQAATSLADECILLVPDGSLTGSGVVLSGTRVEIPDGVRPVSVQNRNVDTVLDTLDNECTAAEAVVYLRADEPFISVDRSRQMLDEHCKFRAHYTFADGYPAGLTPQVLAPALPKLLKSLAEPEETVERPDWLFTVLQRDINSFDVETLLSPVDMRMLRIQLRCDTRGNYVLCRRVDEVLERERASGNADAPTRRIDAGRLVSYLNENREMLRTVPMYVGVQVVDGVPHRCIHSPFAGAGAVVSSDCEYMSVERFERIVAHVAELSPEATLAVCMWGEPLFHPELERLIQVVMATESLSLIVETSGVGMPASEVAEIAKRYAPRVTWIVALDANDESLYREIRGDGFEQAQEVAHALVREVPDISYIQAVRMHESEAHLEHFYRYWKERTDRVIVQKYDDYHGLLPRRKVTDLSPVKRFPCWHNKRDLYVLLDGTVPRCREDVGGAFRLGNAFAEPLTGIWERGEKLHHAHIAEEYPDICAECDEYYTFNF